MTLGAHARHPDAIPFPAIFATLAILCAAAASLFLRLGGARLLPLARCPFKALSGLPCPTCGGTHALAALAGGHFVEALRFNPLVTLAVAGVVAAGAASLFRLAARQPALRLTLTRREELAARGGALALVALNWAYLIARG